MAVDGSKRHHCRKEKSFSGDSSDGDEAMEEDYESQLPMKSIESLKLVLKMFARRNEIQDKLNEKEKKMKASLQLLESFETEASIPIPSNSILYATRNIGDSRSIETPLRKDFLSQLKKVLPESYQRISNFENSELLFCLYRVGGRIDVELVLSAIDSLRKRCNAKIVIIHLYSQAPCLIRMDPEYLNELKSVNARAFAFTFQSDSIKGDFHGIPAALQEFIPQRQFRTSREKMPNARQAYSN
eukprot:TRINITY_DN6788_c0_g1_i1.p1 TRINITY_DN6788_c0_g1~~TRINITY_DN6788_c0_g1_i1.p1  ORF type:complete len:243 (-),score=30.25 TRINITY_DN6788_c0_g1_i1:124-852(-)